MVKYTRDQFEKITKSSNWYEITDPSQTLRVLAVVKPSLLVAPHYVVPGSWIPTSETGPIRFDIEYSRLSFMDLDPLIGPWRIERKSGPIEFTDDQIYSAYVQHENEVQYMSPHVMETRQEFEERDPIGYGEVMDMYERILYRAVGYY